MPLSSEARNVQFCLSAKQATSGFWSRNTCVGQEPTGKPHRPEKIRCTFACQTWICFPLFGFLDFCLFVCFLFFFLQRNTKWANSFACQWFFPLCFFAGLTFFPSTRETEAAQPSSPHLLSQRLSEVTRRFDTNPVSFVAQLNLSHTHAHTCTCRHTKISSHLTLYSLFTSMFIRLETAVKLRDTRTYRQTERENEREGEREESEQCISVGSGWATKTDSAAAKWNVGHQ